MLPKLPGRLLEADQVGSVVHQPIVAYPGYDVLRQQDHWDPATRAVILNRLRNVPPLRFFSRDESELLQAIVDRLLPQDDRPTEERVPIVPWIDDHLHKRIGNGYRFEDMPPEGVAWRMALTGVDQTARIRFGKRFRDLAGGEQDAILRAVADGSAEGEVWSKLPASRFWSAHLISQVCDEYYAHPTAWNEIGFGGPAYPRGYVALNHGLPDPWEVQEVRLDASQGQP